MECTRGAGRPSWAGGPSAEACLCFHDSRSGRGQLKGSSSLAPAAPVTLASDGASVAEKVDRIVVMGELPGVEGATIVDQGTYEELVSRGRDLANVLQEHGRRDSMVSPDSSQGGFTHEVSHVPPAEFPPTISSVVP